MSTSFFPNRPDATRGLARSRVSEGSGRCVSGCACVKSRGESAGDKRFSGSPSARVSRGGGEFFNELSLLFFAMGAKLSAPKVDGYADSSASMRKRYPPPTKIDHHTYLFFVTPLTYEPWANEGRDDDGLLGFVIGEHGFKFVNCRDLNEEFVHYPMSCIDSWAATGKIFRFKYRDTHHEDEVKFMQLTTPWTPALMETLGELVEMSMSKRKAQQMREEDFKELIAELDGMEDGKRGPRVVQFANSHWMTALQGVEALRRIPSATHGEDRVKAAAAMHGKLLTAEGFEQITAEFRSGSEEREQLIRLVTQAIPKPAIKRSRLSQSQSASHSWRSPEHPAIGRLSGRASTDSTRSSVTFDMKEEIIPSSLS